MKYMNRSITVAVSFLALTFLLLSFSLSVNAQTLYSCESPSGGSNPFLHTINPNTGAIISTTEITLDGETVRGCNGMAKHPQTDVCYMIVNVGKPRVPSQRRLATIDQNTGVATAIGNAEQTFSTIAFTADGTLYGVTGNGASPPETLFTIDTNNGSTTQVMPLGNGNDGETLAFNPVKSLLYHGSGNGIPYNDPSGQILETINPLTLQITPRTIQGNLDNFEEQSSMVYRSVNVFLTGTIDKYFFSITDSGFVTKLGEMDHVSKGLAFDCGGAAPVPTMSEWGLISTVIALGLVSFFVLRRRSAFQK